VLLVLLLDALGTTAEESLLVDLVPSLDEACLARETSTAHHVLNHLF
jgi:hypothetical protein